jgi:hypothetical protein
VSFIIAGLLTYKLDRERREHRVFTRLLEMIPGLEERLLDGSEEGVVHIAELVCSCTHFIPPLLTVSRSRKEPRVPGQTTRRA